MLEVSKGRAKLDICNQLTDVTAMFAIIPVHVKVRTAHPLSKAVWSSAKSIAFAAFFVFMTRAGSQVRQAGILLPP